MQRLKKLSLDRSFLGFCGFLFLLGAWLASPAQVSDAAREGLSLCAQVMIPSLFPFFVLSELFVRRGYHRYVTAALRPVMGPLFGLSAEAAGAVALGMVGGYPIGAATAFRLYDRGALTDAETSRLLVFCNNAGPGFVFGVVGLGVFHSGRLALLLYAVHLLSALLVGAGTALWSGPPRKGVRAAGTTREAAVEEPFAVSFVESIRAAAGTMLTVCAFLVFFSVLLAFLRETVVWRLPAQMLDAVFRLGEPTSLALLDGLMELSHGAGALSLEACAASPLLSVCAFLLGWGGLCVHCQTLSLCGDRPVAMTPCFLGKLAQGLLSAVLIQLFVRAPLPAVGAAVILLAAAALTAKFRTGKRAADVV